MLQSLLLKRLSALMSSYKFARRRDSDSMATWLMYVLSSPLPNNKLPTPLVLNFLKTIPICNNGRVSLLRGWGVHQYWAAVEEVKSNYHSRENMLCIFAIYP